MTLAFPPHPRIIALVCHARSKRGEPETQKRADELLRSLFEWDRHNKPPAKAVVPPAAPATAPPGGTPPLAPGGIRVADEHGWSPDATTTPGRPESRDDASLLVCQRGQAPVAHPLPDEGTIRIGRAVESDICIDRQDVSRQHAIIDCRRGRPAMVTHLSEKSDTLVNDKRLVRHRPEALLHGAVLDISDTTIYYRPRPKEGRSVLTDDNGSRKGAADRIREIQLAVHGLTPPDPMEECERKLRAWAKQDNCVVLLGETGVGKTYAAELIHYHSRRSQSPFRLETCTKNDAGTLDTRLFGHTAGAYTGALQKAQPGELDLTGDGTLFLDEIAELPLDLQSKLLEVLDRRTYKPFGPPEPKGPRLFGGRFVLATNADLKALVEVGRFRADLLARFGYFCLRLPPLRERRQAIPRLCADFVDAYARRQGVRAPRVSERALHALVAYDWPHNVRGLLQAIEFACANCDDVLDVADLPDDLLGSLGRVEPRRAASGTPRTPPSARAMAPPSPITDGERPFPPPRKDPRDLTRDDVEFVWNHPEVAYRTDRFAYAAKVLQVSKGSLRAVFRRIGVR